MNRLQGQAINSVHKGRGRTDEALAEGGDVLLGMVWKLSPAFQSLKPAERGSLL